MEKPLQQKLIKPSLNKRDIIFTLLSINLFFKFTYLTIFSPSQILIFKAFPFFYSFNEYDMASEDFLPIFLDIIITTKSSLILHRF